MKRNPTMGFTLIELMVVIAIITILSTLISIVVYSGVHGGQRANCSLNLRNLVAANQSYAQNTGNFVPAGQDLMTSNLSRWHGARKSRSLPFDPKLGPLVSFLGGEGKIKNCPSFRAGSDFVAGFEAANGGYGYNAIGIGSTSYVDGYNQKSFRTGLALAAVDTPSQTLMFADTAFGQPYGKADHLIEYSFAEPARFLAWNTTHEAGPALPSIHFRHDNRANVVWVDGHLTTEKLAQPTDPLAVRFHLGWFGNPPDNTPFQPN